MNGSVKQIAWAESIREKAMKKLEEYARVYRAEYDGCTDDDLDGITVAQALECVEYSIKIVREAIDSEDAKYWIDNRYNIDSIIDSAIMASPICNAEAQAEYFGF